VDRQPLPCSLALPILSLAISLLGCRGGDELAVVAPSYEASQTAPAAAQIATPLQVRPGAIPRQDLVLSDPARQGLLRFARLTCNGQREEASRLLLPAELAEVKAPLIAMLFDDDGRRLGKRRLDDPALPVAAKVGRVVPELCAKNPKGYLHLLVVSFSTRLANFGIKGLYDNKAYEPQVTGLIWEYKGQRAELDPVEARMRNLGPEGSRKFLAEQVGLDARRVGTEHGLRFEIYRTIHFGERYPDHGFADFHRGGIVLRPEQVSHELLQERLRLIGDWYRHNVEDGEVTYEFSVTRNRVQNQKRTMVRSTMATWILNRLGTFLGDAELLRLGDEVIQHYLQSYFQIERSLAAGKILPTDIKLPSGDIVPNRYTAGSFIAAAILERDDWERRQREVGLLMDWAMSYAGDDGVLWTRIAENQYFDPGQLLLAVTYAFEHTRDEKYRRFFEKVYGAYERQSYDMMHLGIERYTPYAPAWYTQPTAKMFLLTGEPRYRDFVYAINDRVAKLYRLNVDDQIYYDYDGALLPKPFSYGNNSITAACLESLVDAAVVAKKDGDQERFATYTTIIRHTVAFLLRLQYVPANTYHVANKKRVTGGFKRDLIDGTLWMDNVWHLTSAFVKVQQNRLLEPTQPAPVPPPAPAAVEGPAEQPH